MALTPTYSELVYSVLNTVRARSATSEVISKEQIGFLIKTVRAQLIKQDANKGYTADSYIIQDLGCVELVEADKAECCDVSLGCTILRTKLPIPSTIELYRQQLFTRIGPVDRTAEQFDFISIERVPFEGNNRFTYNRIKAFMQNNKGYMYFIVPSAKAKLMRYVNIQGVFENPEEASKFNTCEGTSCYTADSPFPIKMWMVPVLIDMVVKTFIKPEAEAKMDLTNNAKTDVVPQVEGN